MMETLQKIKTEIAAARSIIITTHESPDGDAVGSALGLASFLKKIGKEVWVHLQDPVPDLYRFLPGAADVRDDLPDRDLDLGFVLDVGEFRRAGKQFCGFGRIGKLVNLDHHLNCTDFGAYNIVDSNAAATGILVYRLIRTFEYTMDLETAVCLYVAIITDTGSFHYSNADREAFAIAGELIDCGVNAWDVAEKLYENQPRERLELLGLAFPTMEFICGGKVASLCVTLDMYRRTGANAELTDGFINYPRSIRGVEVAIFFRQLEERRYKVGFRSKGKVNVAAFSAALGGGGHHNAAGCTVDGSLDEVKSAVYAIVESHL